MRPQDDAFNAENDRGNPRWQSTIAIVWFVGFLLVFYCLTPPNNPTYRRYQFWPEVPSVLVLLLDTIDPPDELVSSSSGWSYFPQRLDLLATACFILAGAWGIGSLCLRALRVPLTPRSCEHAVFAFATGLACLSLLTLACGLLGVLSAGLFSGLFIAAIIGEAACLVRDRSRQHNGECPDNAAALENVSSLIQLRHLLWRAVPFVPFLVAMLLGAMLPSADFDVREYHLQGPKEYYQAGEISFLPHNVYTSFPFFTEMLSLLAMVVRGDWLRGALAGKAVLMCFGPLTGLALYAAGRRWFCPQAGYIAALVYLTMPWAFRISTIAYAEGGLTFYLFVSLLAFGRALESLRNATESSARWFLLCGLLAGCAMACKYTGVISVVIPLFAACCLAPALLRQPTGDRRNAAVRYGGLFLVGAAVTVGPWLLKNVVETGNPVYPLMYTLLGGDDWNDSLNAKWRAGHSPPNYSDLPERLLEVTAGNDWLTPLLFGLAPLSFLLWKRKPSIRFLWLYVLWLVATWWVLTHRIDRFWVPMTPVIALLAGIGAATLRDHPWKVVFRIGMAAAVLFNLAFIVSGQAGNNSFLVDLRMAVHAPPGIDYLNRTLPQGSRALLVGEAQVFDATFPLIYNTVFDHSIFETWTAASQPGTPAEERALREADDILRKFDDERVTHLYVNWQEILRYRMTYGYTKFVIPDRFLELRRNGVLKAPTTLAVLLDDNLTTRIRNGERTFQPLQLSADDGEQIVVFSTRKELDPATLNQLQEWGTGLLVNIDDKRLLIVGQIFEVAR